VTRAGVKVVDPARQETTDINSPGAAPRPADVAALRATACALHVLTGRGRGGTAPASVDELAATVTVEETHGAV
jgi:hypothetical protein